MEKEYIADCLVNYAKRNAVRGHMPGHKGVGNGILESVFKYDVTELSFSDNLANPTGVIRLAENDVANICGAKRSRILTGGSTLGVLASVYAVKNRGKKMIIQRTSHKSVYNALELLGIEPLILNDCIENGVATGSFSNEELFDCCDNDVIGALLTSPDYFGRALDLKNIKARLQKNGKVLLIDGAHGGHFVFDNPLLYAGKYADVWVDGAHKTLQTLTQGALLHVNDTNLLSGIEEGLSIFSTSSPSYLIMASVESGVKNFLKIKSENENTFNKAKEILLNAIIENGYRVLQTDDNLKVCFLCEKGNGLKIGNELENAGIYPELVSDNAVLFMLGYSFNENDALRVKDILNKNCDHGALKAQEKNSFVKRAISYISARNLKSELIPLGSASGRICAENAGTFPPCYPIITAGEIFDNDVIGALSVKNTFGVYEGKVKVVKE